MAIFDVSVRCIIEKTITVECDTEEEAKNDPWDYVVEETETGMSTWTILSVKRIE